MDIFNYEELLNRSSSVLAKATRNQSRLQIPEPEVFREGKSTIIRNFMDIVDIINRDPKDVAKFLMHEFGIGANIDGKRLIIERKLTQEQISQKIQEYLETYVFCYECNAPDTEIQKIGRTSVLVCKACGAQHPIRAVRESRASEQGLEEGKQYVVEVSTVGPSGEGRANYRGYTILIPGAKKGETVRVLIKKVKNNTAVAEIVDRESS